MRFALITTLLLAACGEPVETFNPPVVEGQVAEVNLTEIHVVNRTDRESIFTLGYQDGEKVMSKVRLFPDQVVTFLSEKEKVSFSAAATLLSPPQYVEAEIASEPDGRVYLISIYEEEIVGEWSE